MSKKKNKLQDFTKPIKTIILSLSLLEIFAIWIISLPHNFSAYINKIKMFKKFKQTEIFNANHENGIRLKIKI